MSKCRVLGIDTSFALLMVMTVCSVGLSSEPVDVGGTKAGEITVSVDPRVELIAIVFRLAGNPEYDHGTLRPYEKAIEKHFGDFDSHPAVSMAAQLRLKRRMSCDGPMSLAAHIDNDYRLRKTAEGWPRTLDERWRKEETVEFIEKLRDFAVRTRFDEFFASQEGTYRTGVGSCMEVVGPLGISDWLREYFGVENCGDLRLILGFVNGFSSYGTRFVNGQVNEKYAIVGMRPFDHANTVIFNAMQIGTTMHEFCHSFANLIVDKHMEQLRPAGEQLFAAHGPAMRIQGYQRWESLMYETATRACVGSFVRQKFEPLYMGYYLEGEVGAGFVWIEDMTNFLKEYEDNRGEYPTFESFFPEFVTFLNEYSKRT